MLSSITSSAPLLLPLIPLLLLLLLHRLASPRAQPAATVVYHYYHLT
jgi:hypothetical protein